MTLVSVKPIAEADFINRSAMQQIIIHENPRRFADVILNNEVLPLSISWRSDLIDPIVRSVSGASCIWIGIDEKVVALTPNGRIVFSVTLTSTLLDIILQMIAGS